ncbi:MAG TPA: outer membrane lipid asymmetry maintenance protein MlaD [Deltaproteobacteria bacterium]|nr:outer membrane lipid asymmetry maintenance protein MlaD [Deltaproteobacteria bacterium]
MGPERKRLEFGVGLFLIIGVFCLGYLSLTLGNLNIGKGRYEVNAVFSTVSGLKTKAQIMMAGVSIGEVKRLQLKDGHAEVTMSINKSVKLEEDSIAGIKTMGIIGDKYISIAPGASDIYIQNGGIIRETQPPLDIESLISRFVFGSMETKKPGDQDSSP